MIESIRSLMDGLGRTRRQTTDAAPAGKGQRRPGRAKGASVSTVTSRTLEPNRGVTRRLLRPIQPNPARRAMALCGTWARWFSQSTIWRPRREAHRTRDPGGRTRGGMRRGQGRNSPADNDESREASACPRCPRERRPSAVFQSQGHGIFLAQRGRQEKLAADRGDIGGAKSEKPNSKAQPRTRSSGSVAMKFRNSIVRPGKCQRAFQRPE